MKTNKIFKIRNINIFSIVVLTISALLSVGCSKEDAKIIPEQEDVITSKKVWRISVEATKENQNGDTKSLAANTANTIGGTINHTMNSANSSVTQEDGWEGSQEDSKLLMLTNFNQTLESYWEDNEVVYVYDNGFSKWGELNVAAGGGNYAILKGTLDLNVAPPVGTPLLLCTIGKDRNFDKQKGTIEDIGENFDYMASVVQITHVDKVNNIIKVSPANFEHRQSITRFRISTASYSSPIKKLTISSSDLEKNGFVVTVLLPDNTEWSKDIYVAIPQTSFKKITYNFTMELEDGRVLTAYKRANLRNGKYYGTTISASSIYETVKEPLTIEALEEGGTITIKNPKGKKFFYAINSPTPYDFINISTVTTTDNVININVNEGDRVQLYGIAFNSGYGHEYPENCTNITCNVKHYVYGNTNSLRYSSGWWSAANSQEVSDYMFASLFDNDQLLYTHPTKKIILPALKVGYMSYLCMFTDCTNMTSPPDLPATTLGGACYQSMFARCLKLKYAPELPATTLTDKCYMNMFLGCTSLEASPILPAPILVWKCYECMFSDCSNLKQIICYATNISASGCLSAWTYKVASNGIFIKNEGTSWPSGNDGIPTGWANNEPFTIEAIDNGNIVITNPQKLWIKYNKSISLNGATADNSSTITIPVAAGDKVRFWGDNTVYGDHDQAYRSTKFNGTAEHYAYGDLRSLLSSNNYPNITSLADDAFYGLFLLNNKLKSHPTLELRFDVTSVGAYSCSSMFFGCTQLERAPKLTATNISERCYESMFYECTSLTEATSLPAQTLAQSCYSGMFSSCTILENAPALPATTLAPWCYGNMFDNCPSLETAPELKASTLVEGCYAYMFRDCVNLNKVTCLATNIGALWCTDSWLSGVASSGTFTKKSGMSWPWSDSGIPSGWSVTEQ